MVVELALIAYHPVDILQTRKHSTPDFIAATEYVVGR